MAESWSAVGASNACPPVISAICWRVWVSGGTGSVTSWPVSSVTWTWPSWVPRAIV